MDVLATLKEVEDNVLKVVQPLNKAERLVLYRYLYGDDCRMEGIDYNIRKTIKEIYDK